MKIHIDDKLFDAEERRNTPKRVARYYAELRKNGDFKFTVFKNPGYDQLIILKNVEFSSLCAHHLMPFVGKAHIGYIPKEKICGVSKLARALDKFASKPQLQERLTQELADFIEKQLTPVGVMVVIEAQHECMRCRGVRKQGSVMVTSAIKGAFRHNDYKARDEFLQLIKG
jgi:GTP cyclohydrolase I